jgi:putative heme-binding domain-containing protein
LQGLGYPQPATVRLSLAALEKLPVLDDGPSVLALVQALRRLPEDAKPLRERLGKYLERATRHSGPGGDGKAWAEWFTRKYPELAVRLGGPDGVDVQGWVRRLGQLDWSQGDTERGRGVFVKASCAACHSGTQAMGPDLRGVTGRFSRDDLMTAIVQPSRDISARYRTVQVETADGKLYQGLVVYEAVDSLILQTGPAVTVRLANPQIVGRRVTDLSLMPASLLDKLSDRDIADLYSYLKDLR